MIALAFGMQYSGVIDITTLVRYNLNLIESKSLPYPSETFVGREQELDDLVKSITFSNHDHRIVNIVGPPGIGKTTLAIHLGHKMIRNGILVHYIDMAEFPDKQVEQILSEKVLKSAGIQTTKLVDFERLKTWARDCYWYNLIILDNCDDTLHIQKEQFLTAIKKIVEASLNVKVLMTGRETVINLDYMKEFKIHELSMTSAYDLLREKVPSYINLTAENGERIAILTGRIPLALKIVTSLLSLSSPLTPEGIILELDTDPIKALSHHALSEKDKVNASFSLSYKHLSNHLKVVGSLIAYFPGSFTTEAAVHSINHSISPEDNIARALRSLVERSLLEHNIRTDRYHYHRLIREFFLVQNKDVGHVYKLESFFSRFHYYYSHELYNYAWTFSTQHKPSLSFLDMERHNIQLLLENLAKKVVKKPEEFLLAINALAISLDFDFLSCRFAREELLQPLRGSLTHLDSFIKNSLLIPDHDHNSVTFDCNYEPKLIITFHRLLCTYESLIHHLAEIENQFHGPEAAVRVYRDREDNIERIIQSTASTTAYIDFMKMFAHYYHLLELKDEEIDCHRRILDYAGKVLANECKSEKCTYLDVARLYKSKGDYSEAADFYERSLQDEHHSVMQKAEIFCELINLNSHLRNGHKAIRYLDELKSMQDEIMASTVSQIFLKNDVVFNIIQLYKQHGLYQNADMLEEKLFESLSAVNATAGQDMLMAGVELARKFFDKRNYQDSIKIGQYILNLISAENTEADAAVKLNVQTVIGRAQFHTGQFPSSLDNLESVFVHPSTDEEARSKLCKYIGVIRPLKHFNSCFPIELHLFSAFGWIQKLLYVVFVPPLQCHTKYNYFLIRPRTARQSVTSSDLLTTTNELNIWNVFSAEVQFSNDIKQHIYGYSIDVLEFCLNSDFIRISINVISILLRLLICYFIYKIALKSISFVIKLGYFKLLFVVAFFSSIPLPILIFFVIAVYSVYLHKLTINFDE